LYCTDGQILSEVQDLFSCQFNSLSAGVISIKVGEGEEVEIGQTVAQIDESASKPEGDGGMEPDPA